MDDNERTYTVAVEYDLGDDYDQGGIEALGGGTADELEPIIERARQEAMANATAGPGAWSTVLVADDEVIELFGDDGMPSIENGEVVHSYSYETGDHDNA